MKKVLITLLAAILGLSFIFTGCSEPYKTFSSEEELEAYIEDAVNAKISDKQSQNDDRMENTKESNKTVETMYLLYIFSQVPFLYLLLKK